MELKIIREIPYHFLMEIIQRFQGNQFSDLMISAQNEQETIYEFGEYDLTVYKKNQKQCNDAELVEEFQKNKKIVRLYAYALGWFMITEKRKQKIKNDNLYFLPSMKNQPETAFTYLSMKGFCK